VFFILVFGGFGQGATLRFGKVSQISLQFGKIKVSDLGKFMFCVIFASYVFPNTIYQISIILPNQCFFFTKSMSNIPNQSPILPNRYQMFYQIIDLLPNRFNVQLDFYQIS
jgi:hypothetical protein